MASMQAPYFPIIYVRGYAMTRDDQNETSADPFCGFNLGSTVMRAVADKDRPPRKFVFESPTVRLAKDFGYRDVYEDGYDILDPEWSEDASGQPTSNVLTGTSIIIYRYYDPASTLLGDGHTPSIETFATGLGALILRVRDLVCSNPANQVSPENFRCYLVAHSMGGLVCRALLQNPVLDPNHSSQYVDKFFTYATPHNGIDLAGMNVPAFLSTDDINNFNRSTRMPSYLNLPTRYGRVDLMPSKAFNPRNIFTMVGTNRGDYEAAAGLSRTFVGHGSDGLVRIENATLSELKADGSVGAECAKAFTFRSHSGYFGIVNSEEAYQNLTRFLFGDVRVDLWLDVADIRLPPALQPKAASVNALYQIELLASPRGKPWYLSRRTAEEDSAACLAHQGWQQNSHIYLSSVFLANRSRVDQSRPSLAYSMSLGVRAPDYEVDHKLWLNEHYEGGYLFRDTVLIELVPPQNDGAAWQVQYAWQGTGVAPASIPVNVQALQSGEVLVEVPFDSQTPASAGPPQPTNPGITGKVRFVISTWN